MGIAMTTQTRRFQVYRAAMDGDTKVVTSFVETPQFFRSQSYQEELNVALLYAAARGQTNTLSLLIQAGADVTVRNDNDNTALHYACSRKLRSGSVMLMLIAAGANVNAQNSAGETALHLACKLQLNTLVHLLLENGADPNLFTHKYMSPLHYACMLILCYDLQDFCSCMGHVCYRYPTHFSQQLVDIVTSLLQYGADVNATFSPCGSVLQEAGCALELSVGRLHIQVIESLVEAGARLTTGVLKRLLDYYECWIAPIKVYTATFRMLMKHGIDLVGPIASGSTPKSSILVSFLNTCLSNSATSSGVYLTTSEMFYCIELLLQNGYPISQDYPFLHSVLKSDSLVYSRYPHLCVYLRNKCRTPCSLGQLCRVRIRRCLSESNNQQSVIKFVKLLPLPMSLKAYIRLDDVKYVAETGCLDNNLFMA